MLGIRERMPGISELISFNRITDRFLNSRGMVSGVSRLFAPDFLHVVCFPNGCDPFDPKKGLRILFAEGERMGQGSSGCYTYI